MAFDVGAIVSHLKLDKKGWDASVKSVEKQQKSMTGFAKKHGEATKKMGRAMTIAGGVITGALGLMVKSAVTFNKEMASVATLIPGQSKRINELKKDVQNLAMAYGKSTSDISGGLYQVVSAFGDAADTAKKLEINVKAGAAGMATTTDAINLTSAVTKGYGDTTAKAVQKAADLAFVTVKLGQTTFPELAAAIGRVVPNAAKLKVSQEELFTVMSTLTGVTGNANEVSTQFAGILRGMMKPTTGMTEAIEQLGFDSIETMIAELGLVGSLRELMATTDGTAKGAAKLYMRTEALTAIFALTGEQADTFDRKLEAMQNTSGSLDEAFNEMSSGINEAGFNMERLKQMTVVLSQKIGDTLAPTIGKIVVAVGKAVTAIITWIDKHPKLTEVIVKVVGAISALMLVLGPLLMILPGIILGISAMSPAFLAVLGPIGLVVGAITLLLATLPGLRKEVAKAISWWGARLKEASYSIQAAFLKTKYSGEELTRKLWELHASIHGLTIEATKGDRKLSEFKTAEEEAAEAAAVLAAAEKKATEEATAFLEAAKKVAGNFEDDLIPQTKKWVEYIKSIGLKTIKEKTDRTKTLEDVLGDLDAALKDNIIDLKTYKIAVKKAGDELRGFSETVVNTADPAAKDMSEAIDEAVGEMKGDIQGFGDEVEETFRDIVNYTDRLINSLGNSCGNFFEKVLNDSIFFKNEEKKALQSWYDDEKQALMDRYGDGKEYQEELLKLNQEYADKNKEIERQKGENFKNLWRDIKISFAQILGDMAKDFAMNFVKKVVGGSLVASKAMGATGRVFEGVGKSVASIGEGIGKLISGLAKGIGAAIEALATSIANAARSLAAAAPQLLIVGAVALALFAGFKAIQSLFGGGGKKKDTANAYLQEIRNKLYEIWNNLQWTLKIINEEQQGYLRDLCVKGNWMVDQNKEQISLLSSISEFVALTANNTKLMLNSLGNIPEAQHGGYFPKETLVRVAESTPEVVASIPTIQRMIEGGGGREVQGGKAVDVNIRLENNITFNTLDPMSMRDVWRKLIEPQMLESLATGGKGKTAMKELLGVT